MKRLLSFILILFLFLSVQGQIGRFPFYVAPTSVAGNNLLTDITSYYKFDDTSTPAVDEVETGNLTVTAGVTFSEDGKLVDSYLFNGSTGRAYNANLHRYTTDFSVSAWVKVGDLAAYGAIVSNKCPEADEPYGTYGWDIEISDANCVSFSTYDPINGNGDAIDYTHPLSSGEWSLIVATFDGDYLRVYKDNALIVTSSQWTHDVPYSGNQIFEIGGASIDGIWITGNIDGVGLWSRVLSTDDISALWNGGNGLDYSF